MAENNQKFRRPKRPLSFKEVVEKILSDAEYARFIHGEALSARAGDKAAAVNVSAHFKLRPKELKALKLTAAFASCNPADCTETNTNLWLLDFATPAKIWEH